MKKRKQSRRRARLKRKLSLIFSIVLSVIFIYCAVRLIAYKVRSVKTARLNQELSEIYEESQPASDEEISAESSDQATLDLDFISESEDDSSFDLDFISETSDTSSSAPSLDAPSQYQVVGEISKSVRKLININPDFVAWISIPTVLKQPIVYRDNEYYLTHDFYGNESSAGTIFLDVNHPLAADTQYLLLHGHCMYDGSMFGYITHYRRKEYIQQHPELTLRTLYSKDTYEIIGSAFVSEDEMITIGGLGKNKFDDEEDFNSFIAGLREHAYHFTQEDIPYGTPLLSLSTCFDDGRLIAIFKRTASEPG